MLSLLFMRRPAAAGVLLFVADTLSGTDRAHAQPAPAQSACQSAAAEERLHKRETDLLGHSHAAEHARSRVQQCEAERGQRPIPARDIATPAEATLVQDERVRKAAEDSVSGKRAAVDQATLQAAAVANVSGRWSAPFVIPVVGITSVLLHTGKVLFWSYDPKDYRNPDNSKNGVAFIWNPATRQGYPITPPENIFCAGQTLLADGRVFIAGGNLRYPDADVTDGTDGWKGTITTYTFNPLTETFTRQPNMQRGRWYPTTTKLADNRVVITSGWDETGREVLTRTVEEFTPSASASGFGAIRAVGVHDSSGLYPFQFTLPSGAMLEAGPAAHSSFQLDPSTWNWSVLGGMRGEHYQYGNAISYTDASVTPARQTIMVAGGANAAGALAGNEWLDGMNPWAGWRAFPRWLQARHNSNTVILPDGSLLTVGGNRGPGTYDQPLLDAELYPRPATDKTGAWQRVEPPLIQAAYHSTALLLPDATVLLSQDDMDATAAAAAQHKAQVYSPPYLFKGARPRIVTAPPRATYGQVFTIWADRPGMTSAVLVAPGATTHGNDMHQRAIKLSMTTSGGNALSARIPTSRGTVPPGYYMLFVLDGNGVPSLARFMNVS